MPHPRTLVGTQVRCGWEENKNIVHFIMESYPEVQSESADFGADSRHPSGITCGSRSSQAARGLRHVCTLDMPHGNLNGVSKVVACTGPRFRFHLEELGHSVSVDGLIDHRLVHINAG